MQYIFKGYWKLSFEELEQKNFLQKIGFLSCIVGWSDFEREKMLNFLHYVHYAVPNCCRTPIPKLHAFSLVTGTRKIFTVTLKRAIFITFLKGSPETNLFFALFKSKNWRETPKLFFKTIFQITIILPIFGEFFFLIVILNFYFLPLFFEVYGRFLQVFKKNNF